VPATTGAPHYPSGMGVGGPRPRLAVSGVVAALVLSACGTGSSGPTAGQGTRTPAPGHSDTSSSVVADPAHAVATPGPFRAPLQTPDMLIFRRHPLSARMVRRIRHVQGVKKVELFSLAQVSIENHAINVAAVDPATYRNFNPIRVARFQQEWNRIAGGEMAIRNTFHQQVSADGYVRMGASNDAPEIHVGAYAPQIPQVDAVVNDSWVGALGMRKDNALLISTGQRTPLSIRKPVQRIVGHQASVQRLDIAARLGLDPSVRQTAFLVGSAADAVGSFSYSVLGGGRIAPEPGWVASHISTETMPIIGPMTCNTQLFPQLRAALDQIIAQGLTDKIHPDQYGGCFVPRFIAGTTTLSNHAFGLAFDINVPENQRGTVGRIDPAVVQIFEEWGFTWGGTWSYTDPMHFELNRLVRPG
jgi:hypothetical protein